MIKVDIGVFAHNEASGIAAMVAELARQDVLLAPGIDARVVVLANGCTDGTVARARAACEALGTRIEVADLAEGGKSRTWNRFVHDLARREADILVFCDADIEMPEVDSLRRLVQGLAERPALWAFNSRPVKDIVHRPEIRRGLDGLIAAAGGTLDDWRTAICGQLYAMRADCARGLHLPIGLPVEDGFLRAMILTDALSAPEDTGLIDGGDVWHVYGSERTIAGLIRHQTRIVIGSAINAAVFAHLRQLPPPARRPALAEAAVEAGWLTRVLRARLPAAPWGYVPVHFLVKRLARMAGNPRDLLRPRRLLVAFAGFGFDLIVYVSAQIRMARGTGAGHW